MVFNKVLWDECSKEASQTEQAAESKIAPAQHSPPHVHALVKQASRLAHGETYAPAVPHAAAHGCLVLSQPCTFRTATIGCHRHTAHCVT